MTVLANSILRVAAEFDVPNSSIPANVWYWRITNDEDETAILDDLGTWFSGTLWPLIQDDIAGAVSLVLIDVDVITVLGIVLQNVGTRLLGLSGSAAADVLPAANSAYLQAYTARPKSFGRKYLPGFAETTVSDGVFIAGVLGDLAAASVAWTASIIGANPETKYDPGVPSKAALTYLPFFGFGTYVTDVPSYQRRRKPGVGT